MCDRCTRLIRAGLVIDDGDAIVLTPMGAAVAVVLPQAVSREALDVALHAAADRQAAGDTLPFFVRGPRRRQ